MWHPHPTWVCFAASLCCIKAHNHAIRFSAPLTICGLSSPTVTEMTQSITCRCWSTMDSTAYSGRENSGEKKDGRGRERGVNVQQTFEQKTTGGATAERKFNMELRCAWSPVVPCVRPQVDMHPHIHTHTQRVMMWKPKWFPVCLFWNRTVLVHYKTHQFIILTFETFPNIWYS